MKHHDFPIWVLVARWQPPDEWLHTDEWKAGTKQLLGEKFGPVTNYHPSGWQVQIVFDAIALSKKTKKGFHSIPRCEILNWQLNPLTDETDNICDLYHYFHEYQLVFNFFFYNLLNFWQLQPVQQYL